MTHYAFKLKDLQKYELVGSYKMNKILVFYTNAYYMCLIQTNTSSQFLRKKKIIRKNIYHRTARIFISSYFFLTFAPRQVLYGQLLLNPPGQECSKGGWL